LRRAGLVAPQNIDLLLPRTRCVRNARTLASSAAQSRYLVSTDTVTETATGLVWERSPFGGTYEEAERHCASLVSGGSTGFRLPHVKEAMTLASALSDSQPCIDPDAFKFASGYSAAGLWTSTPWTGMVDGVLRTAEGQRLTVDIDGRGRIDRDSSLPGPSGPYRQFALCVRDLPATGAPSSAGQRP
jgi:hypothetical protein